MSWSARQPALACPLRRGPALEPPEGWALMLADRRRRQQLLADRSLMSSVSSVVEEMLRHDADPGLGMPRYLAEETEIAGTLLPPGTTVLCDAAAPTATRMPSTTPQR